MSITFHDKAEALEYAKQKAKEGFGVDICGGEAGDRKYVVTLSRKVKRPTKGSAFSKYVSEEEVYSTTTNNAILKRLEKSKAKKLRNRQDIINTAKRAFKKEGYNKVKVEIKKIGDRDGMSDAEVESKDNKVTLVIHPIHQYTTKGSFEAILQHEINHLTEKE